MSIVIMVGQLILGLSILVILHELGHFLAARAFGIKVEKFYLFFDAWNFSLVKFKYKDVEYGIGWLPLGGYVKIAGMIDESMDTEQMEGPPQTLGIPFKTGLAAFDRNVGRYFCKYCAGYIHLLDADLKKPVKHICRTAA